MGVNSPLPARLQEETRKAAKIMRSFVDTHNNGLDKVIPQSVLQKAAGFAIFTVFKAGFVFSARAGSGVVIARTPDGSWSPPSAIGLGGFGFGGQLGAEVTDFLIVLNSPAAVKSFMAAGSLTLGGNLSIAVGPLGRNAEGSGAVNSKGKVAAMYSYSKTKGLFGGVSVEGSIIVERQDANRLAYGGNPTAKQILSGTFDPPDWASELIDGIDRCTGMPGGQKWRSWDEDGEGGGMGYGGMDSPKGERSGYVFGDGVGGHGSPTAKTEGKEGRKRGASVGVFDQGSIARPSLSKRNSAFNPFGSGSSSPKRPTATAGMASSENYNAGLTWDSDGPMTAYGNRSRSGSSALRPAADIEGRARSYSDPKARRPQRKTEEDFSSSGQDEFRGEDLTGTWGSGAADDKGLSSSFARLKTDGGTGGRSRSNSKPPLMASLDEAEYTPYETESKFAARFAKNGANSPLRFQDDSDPFGGEASSSGRAFESYQPALPAHASPTRSIAYASPSRRTGTPPRLDLKPGLSSGPSASETGYARAIALFDLPAGQSGDLALKKGGVIFAMDKVGAGEWWRGMNTAGEAGIFPANYVEVVEIPKELKGGLSRMELKKRVLDLDFDQ